MSENLLYELPDFHVNFCPNPHFSMDKDQHCSIILCWKSNCIVLIVLLRLPRFSVATCANPSQRATQVSEL